MDTGPVTGKPERPPRWELAPAIAEQTQGLLARGFAWLPHGRALFLEIGTGARGGGRWLETLLEVAPVTSALPRAAQPSDEQAAALAFTWTGLEAMGLPETALASFSRPFREGMMQEDRLRRLGDRRRGKWLETVIADGPRWSANHPKREPVDERVGAYDVPHDATEDYIETSKTVHAALFLYTRDEAAAGALAAKVASALQPLGVSVVHALEFFLDVNGEQFSREHFGWADGISQPVPFDEDGAVTQGGAPVRAGDPVHGVPLGEFLIGYRNGHRENAPGPLVPGAVQDDVDRRPIEAGLAPHAAAEGFFDFGLNGSYMVVRELAQDVAAFWRSMDANAETIRGEGGEHAAHVSAEWIAERVVGRDRDGHLLCPAGPLKPDAHGGPDNAFLFQETDPHGVGCPPGSHVRRANPRDALAPGSEHREGLLKSANNHRILRRGRKYGPTIADPRVDDKQERGLLFVCFNTDIARQFEFVQQTWLLNSDFATLYGEVDPLIGPDGNMTIREQPLRRIVNVETFVHMAGGDYFFLPSLPALRYLSLL